MEGTNEIVESITEMTSGIMRKGENMRDSVIGEERIGNGYKKLVIKLSRKEFTSLGVR